MLLSPTEIAVIAAAPIYSEFNGVPVNEGTAIGVFDCEIEGNNGVCEYVSAAP